MFLGHSTLLVHDLGPEDRVLGTEGLVVVAGKCILGGFGLEGGVNGSIGEGAVVGLVGLGVKRIGGLLVVGHCVSGGSVCAGGCTINGPEG